MAPRRHPRSTLFLPEGRRGQGLESAFPRLRRLTPGTPEQPPTGHRLLADRGLAAVTGLALPAEDPVPITAPGPALILQRPRQLGLARDAAGPIGAAADLEDRIRQLIELGRQITRAGLGIDPRDEKHFAAEVVSETGQEGLIHEDAGQTAAAPAWVLQALPDPPCRRSAVQDVRP